MHSLRIDNQAKNSASVFRRVVRRPLPPRRFLHGVFILLIALIAGLALGAWRPSRLAVAETAFSERSLPAAALEARSENGGSTLLPLLSESLSVRIEDGHAEASYDHVFQNESGTRLEGNYRLVVGEGATATGFSYYNGDEKIVG